MDKKKILEWFIESKVKDGSLKSSDVPRHIKMAQRVLSSNKFNEKIKAYWRGRLTAWCKEHPSYPACKGLKIRSGGRGKGLGKGKGKGPIGNPSRD